MNSFLRAAAIVAATIAGLILSSCEREPGSGPNAEGINGGVKVYNVYGEEQDPSGITVTMEQTGKTTLTDHEGGYVFPYLESGTYSFKFTKDGFPATYVRDVEHKRTKHFSTPAPVARVIEHSTYYVTEASVTVNTETQGGPYFILKGKLNKPVPAGKEIRLKLYLDDEETVSLSNFVHFFPYRVTGQEFELYYPYFASLTSNGEMKRGDRVYMVFFTDAMVEDNCTGEYLKPDCTNSTSINTTNPIVLNEVIPQL
ncbi:carboxypeptidase regulatory-like domain-containing protein [Pontibacter sp. Tf4]|uniref:carboxypeptidase-like regulatory domain-containing protein n=1 Tax=Pontibacter sp. Tf4 TaxID=2761620 RepID=UPI001624C70E|nr:carboxypeptidase-like regulatory domain-containing protein [Pontibacter sp. Tf4]MBB6612160.1 carboxypeptidase regulatory-like domain-containing protein [Pontibacter sp. Tf4]